LVGRKPGRLARVSREKKLGDAMMKLAIIANQIRADFQREKYSIGQQFRFGWKNLNRMHNAAGFVGSVRFTQASQ